MRKFARMARFAAVSAVLLAGFSVLATRTIAHAETATPPENCPPGSVGKASGAFAWCEPTVCIIDTDCGPGMVCRTLGLCMNAGTVDKSDSGMRLAAMNVCGANKSCPNDTVCSEKPRCVEPAVAQRMHLTAPGQAEAAPSASAAPSEMMPKKSACGCHVVGDSREPRDSRAPFAIAMALTACVALRKRRAS